MSHEPAADAGAGSQAARLAYVFWHWPRPGVERDAYEAALAGFHRALASSPPAGLVASAAYAVTGATWVEDAAAYEDWYWLTGTEALDPLEAGAIAPPLQASHDAVALLAAGGRAGLYRLWLGEPVVRVEAAHACWLSKPEGTTYPRLRADLEGCARLPGAGLWGRRMVLGPAPEFCLLSAERPRLPSGYPALRTALRAVFSRSG